MVTFPLYLRGKVRSWRVYSGAGTRVSSEARANTPRLAARYAWSNEVVTRCGTYISGILACCPVHSKQDIGVG